MRFDLARLLGPLVAALVLILILQQTLGALRTAGVWDQRRSAAAPAANPFAQIEGLLAPATKGQRVALRDPFVFVRAATHVAPPPPEVAQPEPLPVAPAQPVLTSIVWLESNPSATLSWNGRDYPVQTNTLFDEFLVQSITRTQVTLVRGGETLVLQLPTKGD